MDKSFNKTKFITGMRAYSALAVFLIHSGGGGLRQLSSFTNSVVDYGKQGVISFFVISAFTIYMSVDNNKKFEFKKYLIRRFLRIAPMYYFALIITFFLGGVAYYLNFFHISNDLWGLLLHLTFLNIFNIKYMNSLIGVEWSIPIEFFYYLVIPLIYLLIRHNPKRIIYILGLSFFISFFSLTLFHNFYNPLNRDLSNQWSLEKYFFTFMCGIAAYIFVSKFKKLNFNSLYIFGLLTLLTIYIFYNFPYQEYFISIWISLLIIISSSRSILVRILFENKIIQYLGEISYSIYLVHFPIIHLLPKDLNPQNIFLIGLTITVIISSITYYLIEKPFIKLGRNILYAKYTSNKIADKDSNQAKQW